MKIAMRKTHCDIGAKAYLEDRTLDIGILGELGIMMDGFTEEELALLEFDDSVLSHPVPHPTPTKDAFTAQPQAHNEDDGPPTKRTKTFHNGDISVDNNSQTESPNTQPSPSPGVRIPGPAGSLPQKMGGQSAPNKLALVVSAMDVNDEQNGLVIQSKLKSTSASAPRDDYHSDFFRGAWVVMLRDSNLPPFGM